MTISIIGLHEKANQNDFIIRQLSPTSYRIEEAETLIEVSNNTLFVTTIVVDSIGANPPKAKVETKEYLYRTKADIFLKFTIKDNQLEVSALSTTSF